ncbi:linear primary-alkylsulfatase-like [Clavelina lepadiformis]|uniref:linear primary-alkylsulfatase-like n=1 Tax=Clavelina lepadiformis TaxID=159417 RepID=UPI00404260CC
MANDWIKIGTLILVAAVAYRFFIIPSVPARKSKLTASQSATEASELLKRHHEIYSERRVVKVRDGVYVAIGYAIANMIMLEGTDGIIIVDTTESPDSSLEAYEDFRKVTTKPLKGIIITHFHSDHIYGATALMKVAGSSSQVNVYMHSTTEFENKRFLRTADTGFARGSRQFGIYLTKNVEHLDSGIGPYLRAGPNSEATFPQATHTIDKEASYELAGIKFTLFHTPGETDDQITVWIPEWKVVLPADNIYEAFPNLYPIRGAPPRSCDKWFRSLDKVRRLRAEHMVPSHTRPVSGAENIYSIITHYRDAIQFVHDQTLRLINEGLPVDEIVERVNLPPSLASHPYLQEFYGTVSWSVRAMFSGELGWFDGDPVNLNPLSSEDRAKKLAEFASFNFPAQSSGTERLLIKARDSLEKSSKELKKNGRVLIDELQWALELSFNCLPSSSFYKEAKDIKIDVLNALGVAFKNANARNYYLTCARELEDGLKLKIEPKARFVIMRSMKVEDIMSIFPSRLIAEDCDDTTVITVIFEFPDVNQIHSYTLRHCVLDHISDKEFIPKDFHAKLKMTSIVWKDILTQERGAVGAYASGDIVLEGSMLQFKRFMNLLKTT